MNSMAVQSFNITHGTKRSFFRFPQTEVINFIAVCADTLPHFSILIEPKNKNTDYCNVEDHTMRFSQNLWDKAIEVGDVVFKTESYYNHSNYQQDKRRGKQRLLNNIIEGVLNLR